MIILLYYTHAPKDWCILYVHVHVYTSYYMYIIMCSGIIILYSIVWVAILFPGHPYTAIPALKYGPFY